MPFVVDASAAITWILREDGPANDPELFSAIALGGVVVPAIWSLEVANGVLQALKRRRLSEAQLSQYLPVIEILQIEYEVTPYGSAVSTIFDLAVEHNLTIYDASYVELARRRSLPLVTGDNRMAAAARNLGVDLFP